MKPALLGAVLVLALSPRDAARKVREVIGHRGSCATHPENTLASFRRAIEAKADVAELDVRATKDGALLCLHDEELSRTTNGRGKVGERTLVEVRRLDAGRRFDPKFAGERIPTLREALTLCRGRIKVMLHLKEEGRPYLERVAAEVRRYGDPETVVLGIQSVAQAKLLRLRLPHARQIGLVPTVDDIEPFAEAGVQAIRLWPKWLPDPALLARVRKRGLQLLMGAGNGTRAEVLPLLAHEPDLLSSDDPAQLLRTLAELR